MASGKISRVGEVAVFTYDGPVLAAERDALDLIGQASYEGAEMVAVPVELLSTDFFALRGGLAGAITQKFVNYRMRLAIVGDIASFTAASDALRDFVRESNRGRQLWFAPTWDDLTTRLT